MQLPTSTPRTNPILRLILVAVCMIVFAALIAFSAIRVRYNCGETSNSEFAITELSLSHSVQRADDGSLEIKLGNITNKGARRPCPT